MDILAKIKALCKRSIVAVETGENTISKAGGDVYALAGETWPMYDNKALIPILSIVTDELPYIPEQLKNIKLINVFAYDGPGFIGDEEKGTVVVRTYSDIDKLALLKNPNNTLEVKIKWELNDDFPDSYHLNNVLNKDEYEEYLKHESKINNSFKNIDGIKIGGWPTSIQGGFNNPNFVFQYGWKIPPYKFNDIFMFGDAGIGYFYKDDDWHSFWETS